MNAKKAKALRRIVRNNIHNPARHGFAERQSEELNATPKQISRAFDVVLGTRNFRSNSQYMKAV